MRYIDADGLRDTIKTATKDYMVNRCFTDKEAMKGYIALIAKALADYPATDVEPVVRCKDCKHWGSSIYNHRCSLLSGLDYGLYTQENDYCSYGERKEDE